jgi:peptidoglycan hydrolase CwlO-like protein
MGSHEKFRELCAAATAGELSAEEQEKLAEHLAICADCRRVKSEYEAAAVVGVAALSETRDPKGDEAPDPSWSVDDAQKRFFERLGKEGRSPVAEPNRPIAAGGKRHAYRPSQIRWREIWMPFAAAILLALALGVVAYRSGVKRGADSALKTVQPPAESPNSLEAQVSDAGYERAQLEAKLEDSTKTIDDLKRQLAEQTRIVGSLQATIGKSKNTVNSSASSEQAAESGKANNDAELSAAQAKLAELEKNVDAATAQRDENARQAATLEAKVNELTQLVREREQVLDQKEAEVAKGQELLEHDRDIRELMGARELYMADVHDVSGRGTEKTYGRIFYTKGKSLIFYAFDLDAQPGFQNAKSFQAWGRKGPDKAQARSLGIFYEDNASKKRWVLKAEDPKTLQDIDAVFVTIEPHGGSPHPSGKQLLFASLQISPNHP